MLGTIHTPVADGSTCPREESSSSSPPGTRVQASAAGDVADCWHSLIFFEDSHPISCGSFSTDR